MKAKRVPIDEFDQTLKETVSESDNVFVLFFGKCARHYANVESLTRI
jgi:hypothetical protein